jgi:hypothetical protein
MYDPTNKGEKEDDDGKVDKEEMNGGKENDEEDYNNEELEICTGPEGDTSKFEKDKVKYDQELKFHYLITETGDMGKALPNLMKLENAYPGEPKFLRKRKNPKSLRFYKVKRDLNPARFFLHELMMYKVESSPTSRLFFCPRSPRRQPRLNSPTTDNQETQPALFRATKTFKLEICPSN